jgi:anti-sigma factor RsiW
MMDNFNLTDEDLHAFIDGELDDARAATVAAAIAASAELTAHADRYAADKALIARVYGPLIDRPVPLAIMRPLAQGKAAPPVRRISRIVSAAAAIAAMIVVAWLGYPLLSGGWGDPLVAEALAIRSGNVNAVREFAGEGIATADARDRLAAATLASPVKVPDLEKSGYMLATVAVYPGRDSRQSLQLTYRGRDGRLFTMYLRPDAGADRFDLSQRGDLQICVWRNDRISVVMLGEMSAHEMLKVATATYADLNF